MPEQPHKKENLSCTNINSQYSDISVPIKLKPYALVGAFETKCCGEPIVSFRSSQGANCSCGCEIIITQTICTHIPIEYGTTADIGETIVNCKSNFNCNNIQYR